jgi:protocatechuate 3,4-dioxygenase beta subunit
LANDFFGAGINIKNLFMKRKDFLKGLGIAGAMMPFGKIIAKAEEENVDSPTSCTLIATETRGPYPSDPIIYSNISRSDIRETKTGVLLTLTITVVDINCNPLSGIRVDIWHCDKDGYYSAYNSQPGYLGTQNNSGQTWLRGNQYTNSLGQVIFTSIYPGWYTGRVTHIHAEAYFNGVLQRTSQFAFPDSLNTTVYTTSSFYTPHGTNSIVNSTDNVFSDGATTEMLTVSGSVAAGYAASVNFVMNSVVPLKLISFNGAVENNKAILWWATENEVNCSHIEIESSTNGIYYSIVGTVAAKNGAGSNSYSFADSNIILTPTYYRLKMINTDGSFTYSYVVHLNNRAVKAITVYPNPAKDKLVLTHPTADNMTSAEVLSADGRKVATAKIALGISASSIDISILPMGMYILVFKRSSDKQAVKFFKH